MYIQVQNEPAAAYHELRDAKSLNDFGMKFNELRKQKEIQKEYPQKSLKLNLKI